MEDLGHFLFKCIMVVTGIMCVILGTVLVMMNKKSKEPEKKVVDDGLSTDDEELEPTCNMCGIKYTAASVDIKEPGSSVYTKINNIKLTNCTLCGGAIMKKSKYEDYERNALLYMNDEITYRYLMQPGVHKNLRTLVNEYKLVNPDSEDLEMKKRYIKKLQKDRNEELLKQKIALEESKKNIDDKPKNNVVDFRKELEQLLKK